MAVTSRFIPWIILLYEQLAAITSPLGSYGFLWNPLACGCANLDLDAALLLTIGSFLLTTELLCLQLCFGIFWTYNWSFFAGNWSSFAYTWSSFADSGKVRLISTSTDSKQRSSPVSTKTPTVKKKTSQMSADQFKRTNVWFSYVARSQCRDLGGCFSSTKERRCSFPSLAWVGRGKEKKEDPKKRAIKANTTNFTKTVRMQLFLFTIGSFLLAVELFHLQLTILVFYLQLEFFRLQL